MSKNRKTALIVGAAVFLVLFGIFIYNNIIVPWPYRQELKACIENAEAQQTEAEIYAARNTCFRTYPHFNYSQWHNLAETQKTRVFRGYFVLLKSERGQ